MMNPIEPKGEVRLEIRAKNAILWNLIYRRYGSVVAFGEATGVCHTSIYPLVNLTADPRVWMKDGVRFSNLAVRVAGALEIHPEVLFPPDLYANLRPKKAVVAIPLALCSKLIERREELGQRIMLEDMRGSLRKAIDGLTENEKKVIEARFGLWGQSDAKTLEVVGKKLRLSRERVRQIEGHALNKLRHPARLAKLREELGMPQEEGGLLCV